MKLESLHWFRVALLTLAIGFGNVGCQSPHGQTAGSGNLASVEITGRTTEDIQRMAVAVFTEDYYKLAWQSGGLMVFEKEGSRANNLAYGGLVSGETVVVRVKLVVEELAPGSHLVRSDAFMVRGAGNSFFEEEVPVHKPRRRPYQGYLDQIKKRLAS